MGRRGGTQAHPLLLHLLSCCCPLTAAGAAATRSSGEVQAEAAQPIRPSSRAAPAGACLRQQEGEHHAQSGLDVLQSQVLCRAAAVHPALDKQQRRALRENQVRRGREEAGHEGGTKRQHARQYGAGDTSKHTQRGGVVPAPQLSGPTRPTRPSPEARHAAGDGGKEVGHGCHHRVYLHAQVVGAHLGARVGRGLYQNTPKHTQWRWQAQRCGLPQHIFPCEPGLVCMVCPTWPASWPARSRVSWLLFCRRKARARHECFRGTSAIQYHSKNHTPSPYAQHTLLMP